jgi:transposase
MPKGQLTTEQRLTQNVSRLKTLNVKLRVSVADLTTRLDAALAENEQLKLQLEEKELQRKVLSEKLFKPKTANSEPKLLGKKPGEPGHARPLPPDDAVTQTLTFTPDICPHCHRKDGLGPAQSTVVKYQEDIDLRPLKLVTKYVITKHWCSHCRDYIRSDKIRPEYFNLERLGPNVMAYVLYARYRLRLPYNKIRASLQDLHDFVISEGEIAAQLDRARELFGTDFDAICELVKLAGQVHCDETGWRIGGRHFWIWVFVTPRGLLYKIEDNRSREVPRHVLGDNPDRVLISDFYAAYFKMPGENQFCWVHLLRDSDRVGGQFHEDAKGAFAALKEELAKEVPKRDYDRLDRLLEAIIHATYTGKYLGRVKTLQDRIRKTKVQLLTCLKYPDILPENNTAERALRNNVVMRKIFGGSRSLKGAKAMEVNTSVIDTLLKQNPGQGFFEVVLPHLKELRGCE